MDIFLKSYSSLTSCSIPKDVNKGKSNKKLVFLIQSLNPNVLNIEFVYTFLESFCKTFQSIRNKFRSFNIVKKLITKSSFKLFVS